MLVFITLYRIADVPRQQQNKKYNTIANRKQAANRPHTLNLNWQAKLYTNHSFWIAFPNYMRASIFDRFLTEFWAKGFKVDENTVQ